MFRDSRSSFVSLSLSLYLSLVGVCLSLCVRSFLRCVASQPLRKSDNAGVALNDTWVRGGRKEDVAAVTRL